MLWIYHFEGNPVFGATASETIVPLLESHHTVLSSLFTLGEILVGPKQANNIFAVAQLRLFFLSSSVTLTPWSLNVVERFSDLRAATRVKSPDALQLAFAASAGADFFVTTDAQLLRLAVPGIGLICSPELLGNTLNP